MKKSMGSDVLCMPRSMINSDFSRRVTKIDKFINDFEKISLHNEKEEFSFSANGKQNQRKKEQQTVKKFV